MADHQILLNVSKIMFWKKWEQRRACRGLIQFFEALSLYLRAGFALSYSWPETLKSLGSTLPHSLCVELSPRLLEGGTEESIGPILNRLKFKCCVASHCVWFGVLAELYESGTGLVQATQAISQTLRREMETDLETHLRVLPLKVNVVLMVFFLPPTFLCLFAPLVMEILAQFE